MQFLWTENIWSFRERLASTYVHLAKHMEIMLCKEIIYACDDMEEKKNTWNIETTK